MDTFIGNERASISTAGGERVPQNLKNKRSKEFVHTKTLDPVRKRIDHQDHQICNPARAAQTNFTYIEHLGMNTHEFLLRILRSTQTYTNLYRDFRPHTRHKLLLRFWPAQVISENFVAHGKASRH